MAKIGEHAVVLGASMGGLLAARVLSDFYRTVTVVERDVLPVTSDQRRGVPQGRHAHALWPRGSQILDDLFPVSSPNSSPTVARRWTATSPRFAPRLADINWCDQEPRVTINPAMRGTSRVGPCWRIAFVDGYVISRTSS